MVEGSESETWVRQMLIFCLEMLRLEAYLPAPPN